MKGSDLLFIALTFDENPFFLIHTDADLGTMGEAEFSERSLHRDTIAVGRHLDTAGNSNGLFSYTRHLSSSFSKCFSKWSR